MRHVYKIAVTLAIASNPSAWAQSATGSSYVSIYGILDVGMETARTSGGPTKQSLTTMVSGSNAASRLGFDIHEDLGGGMYAGGKLEHGFEVTTGANASAASFFNRGSYVKLGGSFGEFRFGREYTPAFYVLQQSDINGLNLYGNAGTYTQLGPSAFIRADNSVNYTSPSTFGIVMRATYSFGRESTTPPQDAGRMGGLSLVYDDKSFLVGAYYQVRKDVLPQDSTRTARTHFRGVVGRAKFEGFTLGAGVAEWSPAGAPTAAIGDLQSWWLGASTKLGPGELRAQVGQLTRDTTAQTRPKATAYGLSYLYPFSRRTLLYATMGWMDNNAAGNFRLEASSRQVSLPVAAGLDTRALTLGITHRF